MSLIAVLIPLLFMGDIVGRLFREFAVTLSVTILVSAVVSLTLTPMMCALLHHKPEEQGRLYRDRSMFRRPSPSMAHVAFVLEHRFATLVVAAGTLAARVALNHHSKRIFSGAGYGRDPGRIRSAAEYFV